MINKLKSTNETHPLFPSGDWEGFYTYAQGPRAEQHKMEFLLDFKKGIVTGSGSDDVGGFSWEGAYDKEQLTCTMNKFYITHSVFYKGQVDENGIWGMWSMDFWSGGFHIWPKNNEGKQEAKSAIRKKIGEEAGDYLHLRLYLDELSLEIPTEILL